jgi:hypothetical protein
MGFQDPFGSDNALQLEEKEEQIDQLKQQVEMLEA